MAEIVKRNRIQDTWSRTVAFSGGTELANGNILNVYESLGKYARKVTVITAAGASITLRFNDRFVTYPKNPLGDVLAHEPDLQDPHTYTNEDSASWTIGASTEKVFEMPVKEIRVTALTIGSGVTINCE